MSITVNNPITDPTEFYRQLRKFVGQMEGDKVAPYWDSAHIPTIGVGFNLRAEKSCKRVFEQMGIDWGEPMAIALIAIINDTSISEANLGSRLAEVYGKPFIMTQTQIDAVFKALIGSSVTAAQTASGLPYSQELIALASLHYNTPALFGPGLKAALNLPDPHDARAEIWYQIRYAHANQLHKRRYAEAALFRLYDNPSAAGKDESLAVYRMYTRHRLEANSSSSNMISYDQSHAQQISEANKDLAAAGFSARANALRDELTPAANALQADIRTQYGVDRTFNPLNIQVASDEVFILAGEETDTRTGSKDDLLIGRENGQNWLTGCAGNDVLIGGTGNDYLEGGTGDDILIGGEGIDTYIISSGDGHDTIIDEGRNILRIDGNTFAGVFTRVEGTSTYVFTSDDGTINKPYTMTFNSPGTLTIDGSTSLTFANQKSAADFADHAFGISLVEAPPETNKSVVGTAYRDEMAFIDVGSNPANWQLVCTSFPDDTAHSPFFTYSLGSATPCLQVTGGTGGDFLFGLHQHDEIYGEEDGDVIIGNLTAWNGKSINLPGTIEGDLLDGGAGNDLISGSGGMDQLFGGDGNDFLSGLDADDSLLGGAGNDVLAGGAHADFLSGGAGDDILVGDGYLTGSGLVDLNNLSQLGVEFTASKAGYYTGYVTRNFGLQNDAPNGGDDVLLGGGGRDMLFGGAGADILDGGEDSDSLFGGDGDDWLFGGTGNDWLVGDNGDLTGSGNDTLDGGGGDDELYGLGGDDMLSGDDGSDELYGFTGNDALSGGAGDDTLDGGEGHDLLEGGTGNDVLSGGMGNDVYVFNMGDGLDQISNDAEDWSTAVDTVAFGAGISLEDLLLFKVGDSLAIGLKQTDDEIFLEHWWAEERYRIDRFTFSDGSVLSGSLIDTIGYQLQGGDGNDVIYGSVGNDLIVGHTGDDELHGSDGDDDLEGNDGVDQLYGDLSLIHI